MSIISFARKATVCAFAMAAVPAMLHASEGANVAGISGNTFNPAISVILSGTYAPFNNDAEGYEIPGFPLGGEAGVAAKGLALGESELILSGNVDDLFYANVTAGIHSEEGETTLELEEAYAEAVGVAAGLNFRFGRFFSGIGYLNSQHAHVWDFSDTALPYRALLGRQYADEGVQLTWLAPLDTYLEFGAEIMRGAGYPLTASEEGDRGRSLFLRTGGDVGRQHSWRLGGFVLDGKALDREAGHGHGHEAEGEAVYAFHGDVRVYGVDLVWKTRLAPKRTMKLQMEYLWREESGEWEEEVSGASADYEGHHAGFYAQWIYPLSAHWRLGLRHDFLQADNKLSDAALATDAELDDEGLRPLRNSVMLDWKRNEFALFRLQFNQDKSSGVEDRQLILQYQLSLGAHGAHPF